MIKFLHSAFSGRRKIKQNIPYTDTNREKDKYISENHFISIMERNNRIARIAGESYIKYSLYLIIYMPKRLGRKVDFRLLHTHAHTNAHIQLQIQTAVFKFGLLFGHIDGIIQSTFVETEWKSLSELKRYKKTRERERDRDRKIERERQRERGVSGLWMRSRESRTFYMLANILNSNFALQS